MDLDTVWQLAFIAGLVGFGIWFSHLTFRLSALVEDMDARGEDVEEIRAGIELIAQLMNKLPELMPQFNMNTSPLQPLVEAFVNNMTGQQPLKTENTQRGLDGRYIATTQEEIKE